MRACAAASPSRSSRSTVLASSIPVGGRHAGDEGQEGTLGDACVNKQTAADARITAKIIYVTSVSVICVQVDLFSDCAAQSAAYFNDDATKQSNAMRTSAAHTRQAGPQFGPLSQKLVALDLQ